MEKAKIEQFYRKWQVTLPQRIEGYIYDEVGKILPTRFMFAKFKKILEKFLNNKLSEIEKIILMPRDKGYRQEHDFGANIRRRKVLEAKG